MSTMLVNSAFGFIFWLLAARLFSAQVVGLTAALVSASTIVGLLATLGVGGAMIQSLSSRDTSTCWQLMFWAGMASAVVTSVVVAAAAIVLLPLIVGHLETLHTASYAAVFAVGTVAMAAGAVLDYVYIAERAAGNMLSRNSFVAAAKVLVVIVLAVALGTKALDLLDAWALASVVGLGFGIFLLRRRVQVTRPPRPLILGRTALGLRSSMAGHQLIGMGAALLPYLLPLVVAARLSTSDNAYFYTTWMMAGVFLIISPALSQSLFAEGVHSPDELVEKARAALVMSGAILVPCVVGAFVLGGVLLSAFGAAYEQHAVGLLRIVLFASIPDAVTNVYVAVLRVRGRLAAAAGLNLGMGGGIVVLCWIFLPSLGISAVGWAFLAMQLSGCIFVFVDLLRESRSGVQLSLSQETKA